MRIILHDFPALQYNRTDTSQRDQSEISPTPRWLCAWFSNANFGDQDNFCAGYCAILLALAAGQLSSRRPFCLSRPGPDPDPGPQVQAARPPLGTSMGACSPNQGHIGPSCNNTLKSACQFEEPRCSASWCTVVLRCKAVAPRAPFVSLTNKVCLERIPRGAWDARQAEPGASLEQKLCSLIEQLYKSSNLDQLAKAVPLLCAEASVRRPSLLGKKSDARPIRASFHPAGQT